MKCEIFIFICGYLMTYCNGDDLTSSSTSSSIVTSPSDEGISSTYGISSGDGISSTDISSSTDVESSTDGISSTNGTNSTDDLSYTVVTSYTDGMSTSDGTSSTNNISSTDSTSSTDAINFTDGMSSADGTSFTDGIRSTDGITSTDGISSTDSRLLKYAPSSSKGLDSIDKVSTSTTLRVETSKTLEVKDVMQKICSLAKKKLKDAKKEEITAILEKLENKLIKTSQGKSYAQSYVQIIMKGISSLAERNDYSICEEENKKEDIGNQPLQLQVPIARSKNVNLQEKFIENGTEKFEETQNKPFTDNVKQKLIQNILHKLKKIANKNMDNAVTPKAKTRILEKIKEKFLEIANRTFGSINPSLVDLVLKGLEWNVYEDQRRMTFENVDIEWERRAPDVMPFIPKDGNTQSTPSTLMTSSGVTTEYDCSAIQKKICSSVHNLNEYICSYDDTVISVEKICDGRIDCHDGSDEKDCVQQAILRAQNATHLMKDIGLAKNCLFPLIENSMFYQVKMMSEVLTSKINFINKYKQRFPSRADKEKARQLNQRSLVEVTSDLCFLLRSFVIAMDGALCTDTLQSVDEMDKKLSDPIDRTLAEEIDVALKNFKIACDCYGPYCVNMTCPIGCRRICFQRNSLMLWSCKATDGSNGVTLDLICDGKFDCHDETDETGCALYNSAAKFEANKIYDSVLKTIRALMSHFGFKMAQSQLGQLYDTIRTLQFKSINPKTPSEGFKKFRDKAILLIVEIFDESLNSVAVELKADSALEYLEFIKEKLIIALKKTYTGNKKIIAPDGCFCRGLECAVPMCSQKCIRTCLSKPKLTKYLCSSTNSTYIPLEQICNGKKNCPRGEDEDKCKPELCRRHHVADLRSKLTNVGVKHAGTVLGEVLINWRTKAQESLRVLENQERQTANDFKIAMSEMLEHLVASYVTLEDFRRLKSGSLILNKYEKLAQRMMETLKSCTNSGLTYPGGPLKYE